MPFTEWAARGSRSTSKKVVVGKIEYDALAVKCHQQEAALKEIVKVVEAAMFFEGQLQIYKSIRRIAKAGCSFSPAEKSVGSTRQPNHPRPNRPHGAATQGVGDVRPAGESE